MRKFDQLYFIAIIPPIKLKEELMELKRQFGAKYNCKASLNSPPHITLHMPFRYSEKKEEHLIDVLKKSIQLSPFVVELNGFSAFPPRVIFINTELTDSINLVFDQVKKTMRSLNIFNAGYQDRGFHPHLTIAFRDLKKSIFPKAWEEYEQKSFEATFIVEEVMLLKHNGHNWDEYKAIPLEK